VKKPPFYESNFGAAVIGGLVVVVISTVFNALVDDLKIWQLAIFIVSLTALTAFVTSVVKSSWRQATWLAFASWTRGLGLLTNQRRADLIARGYDTRDEEVRAERRRSQPPAWHVDAKGIFNEDGRVFWLNNRGHLVRDVRLLTDAQYFLLDADAFWPGDWSSGTGKYFEGTLTKKGATLGVPFQIEWIDQNGDARSTTEPVLLRPEQMQPAPTETREQAYRRGRESVLAEQNAAKTKRVTRPAWQVGRPKSGGPLEFLLVNHAIGSVAEEVILEAPSTSFTFMSAREVGDVNGGATAEFRGRPTQDGHYLGVTFGIDWTDEHGDRRADEVLLPEQRDRY
jgi:hypothetical protein